MKIAVTGINGRLGSAIRELYPDALPLVSDITKIDDVRKELDEVKPDVVINCSAYTDVDGCQENHEKCFLVNFQGVKNVRNSFKGRMITFSTDYVFDGKTGNYSEKAVPHPLQYYGVCKDGADIFVQIYDHPGDVIVRTSGLYGSHKKIDFVQKVLNSVKSNDTVSFPTSLEGSYTNVHHLATQLLALVHMDTGIHPQIVNLVEEPILSRYELALMIADIFKLDKSLITPTKKLLPGSCPRPHHAGLNVSKAKKLGIPIFTVTDGLKIMRDEWK